MTREDLTQLEHIEAWFTPFSNHEYWGKMDYWTINQGITLLLDYCPHLAGENIPTEYSMPDYNSDFINDYNDILAIAKTSLKSRKILTPEIYPSDFIKWADDKDIYVPEALRKAVSKYYRTTKKQDLKNIELQDAVGKNTDKNKLSVFQEMKNLLYSEVTFTFIAGEMIEIEARNEKCKVGYEYLSLKNMNTGVLNGAGLMLLALAQNKKVPISTNTKNKQALKKVINNTLGLKSEPIPVIGDNRNKYYDKHFNVVDVRSRADDRAKERAEKLTKSYNEEGSAQSWDLDVQADRDYDGYDDEIYNEK